MKLTEYQVLAMRTEKMFDHNKRFQHAAIGIDTEKGEFQSEVKRAYVYGKVIDDEMLSHMAEELGDMLWYLAIPFNAWGVPMSLDEEGSWLLKHISALGMKQDIVNELSINDPIKTAFLYDVGAMMSVNLGRFVQNSVTSDAHAQANIRAILGLVWDAAWILGIEPSGLLIENINKLKLRYPDKYTDQAAEARADKGGASHLVS